MKNASKRLQFNCALYDTLFLDINTTTPFFYLTIPIGTMYQQHEIYKDSEVRKYILEVDTTLKIEIKFITLERETWDTYNWSDMTSTYLVGRAAATSMVTASIASVPSSIHCADDTVPRRAYLRCDCSAALKAQLNTYTSQEPL